MAEQSRGGRGKPAVLPARPSTPTVELPGPPPVEPPEPPELPEPGVPGPPAAATLTPPPGPEPVLAGPVVPGPAAAAGGTLPDHLGYFNADVHPPVLIEDIASVFVPVPGMATLVRTRCRVLRRHRVPNTDQATDTLLYGRGVQVPASVADALVADDRARR